MLPYNSLSKVQEDLLAQNRIDLVGDVDQDMLWYVREAIIRLRTRPSPPTVIIDFSSNGGSLDFGLDIYDILKLYPGKKIGVVQGIAASMAAIILQVCDVRMCLPNSSLLIHHLIRNQIKFDVFKDKEQLNKLIRELEASQAKLNAILKSRTGQHMRRIEQISKEDREMKATEALQFGLIDVIISTEEEIKAYVDGKHIPKRPRPKQTISNVKKKTRK